jgi:hypothetical protein
MRKSRKSEYTQSYNAQAAVGSESTMLVLGACVTDRICDANELVVDLASIPVEIGVPKRAKDIAPVKETLRQLMRIKAMAETMKTDEARRLYRLRKQSDEPVFGIVKQAMGFRQFLLRGMEKVELEWELVLCACNLRRLAVLRP